MQSNGNGGSLNLTRVLVPDARARFAEHLVEAERRKRHALCHGDAGVGLCLLHHVSYGLLCVRHGPKRAFDKSESERERKCVAEGENTCAPRERLWRCAIRRFFVTEPGRNNHRHHRGADREVEEREGIAEKQEDERDILRKRWLRDQGRPLQPDSRSHLLQCSPLFPGLPLSRATALRSHSGRFPPSAPTRRSTLL